jgi:integrase
MMFPSYKPANDSLFHTPRARNSPIKSSLQSVEGLPEKLKIFRISGSKYWQMRYFKSGRYFTRSLKRTDLQEAITETKKIFHEVLEPNFSGNTPDSKRTQSDSDFLFDFIQELLRREQDKVKRDELKFSSFLMTKSRLEGFIFEFFKDKQLSLIDTDSIESFVNFLTLKGLSAPTIQGYLSICKKLLRLLFRKEVIARIPLIPVVKSSYKPRGGFTITEYKSILRKSKELRLVKFDDWGDGKRIWIKDPYQTMPFEMHLLIRFMVYTFVRPGDIRQLKNRHVETIVGNFRYLRLTLPEIKRHSTPIVSLPPAVKIYQTVKEHHTLRGFGKPDDYVFFPEESNRRLALDVMGWLFNWIVKELGIKKGPHGASRSLYSLRHTAITFRLIYGGNIDLLTLARNSRTSVEMIEKFYASTLAAEVNIDLLHAKRKRN